MKILFSTPTSKQYIGCPQLSDQQVICGPGWENETNQYGYSSIRTPSGLYDLQKITGMLSANQQPEMVIVWADSSMTNVPCNLRNFKGPRILILGDTQHLNKPLQNLITYAKSEPFDMVLTINNRQHAHFFVEAGIKNMYWLPGFGAQIFPSDFIEERSSNFVFVGQVGKFHPRRVRLIPQILEAKLPLVVGQLPAIKAAEAYATNLGSFHCSLNGDMSFRNFEVLSAGGFLLADRLSEQSGMELLFKDEKHWVSYGSLGELQEKMQYYVSQPKRAIEIARKGYEEFWRNHSPERKKEEFFRLVSQQEVNPIYDITKEKRIAYFTVDNHPMLDRKRIELFEFIQDLHRREEQVNVMCGPGANIRLICDMADLPRLKLFVVKSQQALELLEHFQKAGVAQAITWIESMEFFLNPADVWVVAGYELERMGAERLLKSQNSYVVISDCISGKEQNVIDLLESAGFVQEDGNSMIFHRVAVSNQDIESTIAKLAPWQEAISLPKGVITPGKEPLNIEAYRLEQIDFSGKRILEVGSGDGYWTYYALQHNARQVVAIDNGVSGGNERFEFCRQVNGYQEEQCTRISLDIYEISPERLGYFDIILFFGQISQLRHPLLALDKLSSVCTGELYIESFILDDFSPVKNQIQQGWMAGQSVMEGLSGEKIVSGWLPTLHCLGYMVRSSGFKDVVGWKVTNIPSKINECRGFIKAGK